MGVGAVGVKKVGPKVCIPLDQVKWCVGAWSGLLATAL
jgi:hypothetical protein